MSVRAKFRYNRCESSLTQVPEGQPVNGVQNYVQKEQRTFFFHPVYSNVEGSENKKFWESSPNGELRLGCVNPEVWPQFELGKDYYLDFTAAE